MLCDVRLLNKLLPRLLDSRYPDLFQSTPSTSPPTTLSTAALQSLVLAHAPSYHETASRLTSLKDIPIPPTSSSATLVALQPRLDRALQVQEEQRRQVAELRARSARLAERWVEVGVVGVGECWAEWEERLRVVEREVRRREVEREEEMGA